MQDPQSHELSQASKIKLSNSIKLGKENGKYKTKYDYCKIEMYDYYGNYIKTFSNKDDAITSLKLSKKKIQRLISGYRKGVCINGIRLRASISKVPVLKFKPNNQHIGNHFVFFFKDSDGKEKLAFKSVKDCWKFFGEHAKDDKIEIIPKLKCLLK